MTDSPSLSRLRSGHFNTADWNATGNPGGMGGDGHRYALIPPKAPQTPTYPVLVNDLVTVADEAAASADAAAGSASAAAGSQTSAQTALNDARLLLAGASLDGTSDSTSALSVTADAKVLNVATNKAFRPGQDVQVTRKSAPTTWLRGTVTDYNAGTGALSVTFAAINAPAGTGPWNDWTVSITTRQDALGGAATLTMTGNLTLTTASARVQVLDPGSANRDVTLPPATNLSNTGGPVHLIRNVGTSNTVTIKNSAGTSLARLSPQQTGVISCHDRTTAAGGWDVDLIGDANAGAATVSPMTTSLTLNAWSPRVQYLYPTIANLTVDLPDATTAASTGNFTFEIYNANRYFPLTVRTFGGSWPIATIPFGQAASICLIDRSRPAGQWQVSLRPLVTARPLVANSKIYVSQPVSGSDTDVTNFATLSPTSQPTKAIYGYVNSRGLTCRVLSVNSNGLISKHAEGLIVSVNQDGINSSQVISLTDTLGIAAYSFKSGSFAYINFYGVNIDLNQNTVAVNQSFTSTNVIDDASATQTRVRLKRIPGFPNHCLATFYRDATSPTVLAALVRFDGTSLQVSSIATASTAAMYSFDTVVLNGTTALQVLANNSTNQVSQRTITFNPTAMTVAIGAPTALGANAYIRSATPVDNSSAVFCGTTVSRPFVSVIKNGIIGQQVPFPITADSGFVYQPVITSATNGFAFVTEYAPYYYRMYIQEFTISGSAPYITCNSADLTLIEPQIAPPELGYSSWSDNLKLDSTTTLFAIGNYLLLAQKY